MATETAPAVSFEQAYAQAQKEHSQESTPAPETPPAPPVETPPPSDTETKQPTPEPSEPAAEPDDSSAELILSKEELGEISKLPAAEQYKRMQKAYTQKTMNLAEERKALDSYRRLIGALNSDPIGTIRLLAEHHGLKFQEAPQPEVPKEPTAAEIRATLDPDILPTLEPILKIVESLEQRLAKAEGTVVPLMQRQEEQTAQIAEREAQQVMKTFGDKHKGWQTHEAKMLALSEKLLPNGMDETEYLETLYALATRDIAAAESVKNAIVSMQQAATNSESPSTGVSNVKVSPTAPKVNSQNELWEKAAQAAKAGIVWES